MSDKIISATELCRNFAKYMLLPMQGIPLKFRYKGHIFVIEKLEKSQKGDKDFLTGQKQMMAQDLQEAEIEENGENLFNEADIKPLTETSVISNREDKI